MRQHVAMLALLIAAAGAFHLHENGRDVDFTYSWPVEASAIPSLKAQLKRELRGDRLRSAKEAGEFRRAALRAGFPFHQHEFRRTIEFAGQSRRLASFRDAVSTYTGGAHPMYGIRAVLWDKATGKESAFKSLFMRSPTPILRPGYCKGLAAERKHKLGRERPYGDFWEVCPDPMVMAIVPTDRDGNGRFDRLSIIASPYAVGSWAEGEYVVTIRTNRALIVALRPEYRSSFEAQPQ
jgi:hypothetical protein